MRMLRRLAFATLALIAWLGIGQLERGRLGVAPAQAAGGCGIGFHRGLYGVCRPNYGGYYGGPGYYRGGAVYGRRAVYGYRGGYYGRKVYGGRVYRGGGFRGGRAAGFHGGRGFRGGGFHGGGRFRR